MDEYSSELISRCKPIFFQGFKAIYDTTVSKSKNKKYILREFQEALESIPNWNSKIIENEYERFKITTRCNWIDDLIEAAFLSLAKRMVKHRENSKIDLVIPHSPEFIHKCYINIAREFWKKPKLFFQKVSRDELKENMLEIHEIISAMILETLRLELPYKDMLKNFLDKPTTTDTTREDMTSRSLNDTVLEINQPNECNNQNEIVETMNSNKTNGCGETNDNLELLSNDNSQSLCEIETSSDDHHVHTNIDKHTQEVLAETQEDPTAVDTQEVLAETQEDPTAVDTQEVLSETQEDPTAVDTQEVLSETQEDATAVDTQEVLSETQEDATEVDTQEVLAETQEDATEVDTQEVLSETQEDATEVDTQEVLSETQEDATAVDTQEVLSETQEDATAVDTQEVLSETQEDSVAVVDANDSPNKINNQSIKIVDFKTKILKRKNSDKVKRLLGIDLSTNRLDSRLSRDKLKKYLLLKSQS
jgi:hypothetical protein